MAKRNKKSPAKRSEASGASTHLTLVALVLAALVLVASCLYVAPYYPDDVYISFRYAENLVDGHGLSFNPNEPVEAYSNFLWIMVCAALYKAGLTLESATPYAGVLLALGGLFLLWLLARRRCKHPAQMFVPLLVYATAGPFVLYAISGMETALFGFLLMALVYCAERVYERGTTGGWVGLTVIGVLLALTRPEGIVVLPAVLAYMVFDSRGTDAARATMRLAGISAAAFVVAYGAYTVWRVTYFGEWVPTPFMSKGYEAFPILTAWQKNFEYYFVSGSRFESPAGYLFLALGLAGVSGLVSNPDRGTTFRIDRLALVIAALMFALYTAFVDWMPSMRYQAPLVGLLCVPLVGTQRIFAGVRWSRGLSSAGVRVVIALVLLMGGFGLQRMKIATRSDMEGLTECMIPLGRWLNYAVPSSSLLAIGDVGAVPYYSGLRVLDIHPESLTDIHIARDGLTAEYILLRGPQVVAFSVRGIDVAKMHRQHYRLYRSDQFRQRYQFIGTVRDIWNHDRSYWVFIRRDVELKPDALTRFPTGVGHEYRLGFDANQLEQGK